MYHRLLFFLTGYQLFLSPMIGSDPRNFHFWHPLPPKLEEKSTYLTVSLLSLSWVRKADIQLPFRPHERRMQQIQVVNISLHVFTSNPPSSEMTICQFRGIVQWCILQSLNLSRFLHHIRRPWRISSSSQAQKGIITVLNSTLWICIVRIRTASTSSEVDNTFYPFLLTIQGK